MSTSDEALRVMSSLRRIVRHLRLADRAAESAVRISAAQLFVLRMLVDKPAASLSELAERTLTDQSSVSTVVARLVAAKLVKRVTSTVDRRRSEIAITAAGLARLKKAPATPQTKLIASLRALPVGERKKLAASLDRLVTLMGADGVEPRMLFED